jgi:hypothetical protein
MKGKKERHKIAEERRASLLEEFLGMNIQTLSSLRPYSSSIQAVQIQRNALSCSKKGLCKVQYRFQIFSAPEYLFVLHLRGLDDTEFFGSRQSPSFFRVI